MIAFNEAKAGDWVRVNYEGQVQDGEITEVNMDEGQVGVETASGMVAYFAPEDVTGVPVDDEQLARLRFEKETTDEGYVKYKHGPFRLLIEKADDFSHSKLWYREDIRQITYPLYVHQLQNFYRSMTKVELTES
jgi:hypothetical protein